ncbi:MAG: hypothetical protein V4656_17210 [Pseudomonadota bacterium]
MTSPAAIDEIEDRAIALVAEACASVPTQRAMAAAIMRHAGNALARLASPDDAFLIHTQLARRHQVRMTHRGVAR